MRAGSLKKKVSIEQPVLIDGIRGKEESWVSFKDNVRCSIEALKGKKYWDANQSNSEITHEIWLRYINGVTAKMRINFNGRIFEMISPPIDHDYRPKVLELKVKELIL